MAKYFKLPTLARILLPLLLLTTITTLASANQHRQQRRHRKRSAAVGCRDPTEQDLRRTLASELSQPYVLHESFYQHEDLRTGVKEDTLEIFEQQKKGPVAINHAALDSGSHRYNCTPVSRTTAQGTILDPCPIKWVLNVDINREPRVLVEGQCNINCTACLSNMGQEHQGATPSPGSLTSCQSVSYYTKVLRKTYECDLKKKVISFASGCSCSPGSRKRSW
ncbi:hypothetical protein ACOMHN_041651 [Nucella lapillus]